jgi:amidohydrolase
MIADGVMEDPKVDMAFGFHIHAQSPVGLVKLESGPVLAAADRFKCTITGLGGHGAEPHKTVDALLAACQAVNLVQSIASRNVGPLDLGVVSVGTLHAGSVFNAIAETAEFTGTIRSYNAETRALILRRLEEIVTGAAAAFGAQADVEVAPIVPALVNDPAITQEVTALFIEMLGEENLDPDQRAVPSDDLAEFLARAPGCNFSLGAAPNENPYPHHNSRFDINEDALPIGAALFAAIVMHYLVSP